MRIYVEFLSRGSCADQRHASKGRYYQEGFLRGECSFYYFKNTLECQTRVPPFVNSWFFFTLFPLQCLFGPPPPHSARLFIISNIFLITCTEIDISKTCYIIVGKLIRWVIRKSMLTRVKVSFEGVTALLRRVPVFCKPIFHSNSYMYYIYNTHS